MSPSWLSEYEFVEEDKGIIIKVSSWRELDEVEKSRVEMLSILLVDIIKTFNELDIKEIKYSPIRNPEVEYDVYP